MHFFFLLSLDIKELLCIHKDLFDRLLGDAMVLYIKETDTRAGVANSVDKFEFWGLE